MLIVKRVLGCGGPQTVQITRTYLEQALADSKITLLSLVALLIILIICAISYRAIRQHQNSAALAIRSPNSIDEAMFVPVGGIDQWITIRGQNRDNPVVLFLHGGPGTPTNLLDFSMAPRLEVAFYAGAVGSARCRQDIRKWWYHSRRHDYRPHGARWRRIDPVSSRALA